VEAEWRRKGKSGDATPLPSQVGVKWPSTEVWFGKIIVSFATGGYIIVFELDFIYSAHSQVENSFHTLPPCVFTHPITLSNDATLLPDSISTTMSEITTSEVMYGTAGVVNGKLQLSQGITRDLSWWYRRSIYRNPGNRPLPNDKPLLQSGRQNQTRSRYSCSLFTRGLFRHQEPWH
jgi:hypothetical protein